MQVSEDIKKDTVPRELTSVTPTMVRNLNQLIQPEDGVYIHQHDVYGEWEEQEYLLSNDMRGIATYCFIFLNLVKIFRYILKNIYI